MSAPARSRLVRVGNDLGQAAVLASLWSLALVAWLDPSELDPVAPGEGFAHEGGLLVLVPPALLVTCWLSFPVVRPLLVHRGWIRRVLVALVLPPFGAVATALQVVAVAVVWYALTEPESTYEVARSLGATDPDSVAWIPLGACLAGLAAWLFTFPACLVMGAVHTAWLHVRTTRERDALAARDDERDDGRDDDGPGDLLDEL